MANLVAVPGFDPVFQLETDTLALGGPGQPMNFQAQALLNRTAYLKILADTLKAFDTDLMDAIFPGNGTAKVARSGQIANSIDELRTLIKTSASKNAFVTGYYAFGDGGGGHYYLDESDMSSIDNGGSIIEATDGGRWKLIAHGSYNAKCFGCRGNGVDDDSAPGQACIDAAMDDAKNAYFPGSNYRLVTGLVVNNSTSTSFIDTRKISILGDGAQLTTFTYDGPAGSCLKMIGGQVSGSLPMQSLQEVRGICFFGGNVTNSVGLDLDTTQHIKVVDVEVIGFDLNLGLVDVDFAMFDHCIIHFGKRGILGEERSPRLVNSTRPNALTFIGCKVGGNSQYGATFIGGACVNFFGGHFEGNGIGGTGNRYALLMQGSGVQGGIGCNIEGTYFEQNAGVADIWLINASAPALGLNPPHCVYNIKASFNRVSGTNFTDHNILCNFNSSLAGKQKLRCVGSSFKGYNDYAPSAARKYIEFSGDPRNAANALIEGCVMQDDIESVPQNDYYNVSLALSATQSIATGTAADVLWTSEVYDADSMHAPNSASIIAPVTGKYQVTTLAYWQANTVGIRTSLILKGGVEIAGDTRNASSTGRVRQNVTKEVLLNKGDVISFRVFQDSGASLTLDTDGTSLTLRCMEF